MTSPHSRRAIQSRNFRSLVGLNDGLGVTLADCSGVRVYAVQENLHGALGTAPKIAAAGLFFARAKLLIVAAVKDFRNGSPICPGQDPGDYK